jgi:hypothetical protein
MIGLLGVDPEPVATSTGLISQGVSMLAPVLVAVAGAGLGLLVLAIALRMAYGIIRSGGMTVDGGSFYDDDVDDSYDRRCIPSGRGLYDAGDDRMGEGAIDFDDHGAMWEVVGGRWRYVTGKRADALMARDAG